MKPTKSDYEYFFNTQFTNGMCGLNKNRPYASFGPVTIKYEPEVSGPFTEIKWDVAVSIVYGDQSCHPRDYNVYVEF